MAQLSEIALRVPAKTAVTQLTLLQKDTRLGNLIKEAIKLMIYVYSFSCKTVVFQCLVYFVCIVFLQK